MATAIKVPYEVLIRWSEGKLSGVHVCWSILVTEDNGTKRELPQPAEPVDIGQGKGFPLAAILKQVNVDALMAVAARDAEIAKKEAALSAALREKEEIAATISEKDEELAVLRIPEKERLRSMLRAKAAELLKQADALHEKRGDEP